MSENDDDDTLLEHKARELLCWSDDRIARTCRLDIIDALSNQVNYKPHQYALTCKPRSTSNTKLLTIDDLRSMQIRGKVFQQPVLTQKKTSETHAESTKTKQVYEPKNNTAEELSRYCTYLYKKQVGYAAVLQKKNQFLTNNKDNLDLHDRLVLDASIHNTNHKTAINRCICHQDY